MIRLNDSVCGMLLAIVLALSGCQTQVDSVADAVVARGTLTKSGEPLQVAGREVGTGMVSLTFLPTTESAGAEQSFGTVADERGIFDLPGGMPAGEYRVAVRQWEPYPTTDKLGGRYDEEHTSLVVLVDGKSELKIELE